VREIISGNFITSRTFECLFSFAKKILKKNSGKRESKKSERYQEKYPSRETVSERLKDQ